MKTSLVWLFGTEILLSMMWFPNSGLACPRWCSCPKRDLAVCSHRHLKDLPQTGFHSSTKEIDLSFNDLSILDENIIPELGYIEVLNLSHNEISYIDISAFIGHHRLKNVDLSWNRLTRINRLYFKEHSKMQWLSLSGNSRLHINNDGNLLDSTSLRYLDMSHCALRNIPTSTFAHLNNIRRLNLSHNQLSSLQSGALHGLSALEMLDLSHNQMSTIRVPLLISTFTMQLNVAGNPWTCDCDMRKIYLWNEANNRTLDVVCKTPEYLSNERWSALQDNCTDQPRDVEKLLSQPYGSSSVRLTDNKSFGLSSARMIVNSPFDSSLVQSTDHKSSLIEIEQSSVKKALSFFISHDAFFLTCDVLAVILIVVISVYLIGIIRTDRKKSTDQSDDPHESITLRSSPSVVEVC